MSDPLTIIHGDALSSLRTLESESVQTCVTSPPYWGLRDYGYEWQIGLEKRPEEYVARLAEIFAEVKRVLRCDGTLWLNLGDTYAGPRPKPGRNDGEVMYSPASAVALQQAGLNVGTQPQCETCGRFMRHNGDTWECDHRPKSYKSKDLVGIPWMVAFALRADGWYLRSDIIWSKPNPMPESVTDRPTKSHEYIFLLSKSERYYYNAEAIKEPGSLETPARMQRAHKGYNPPGQTAHGGVAAPRPNRSRGSLCPHEGFNGKWDAMSRAEQCTVARNKRSVWTVATSPFPDAHFATFPPDLITPCILAGSRPAGKRCDCDEVIETPLGAGDGTSDPALHVGRAGFNRPRKTDEGTRPITRREQRAYAEQMKASPHRAEMATQASTAFEHYTRTDKSGARPLPPALLNEWLSRGWLSTPEPCSCPTGGADTVLDPFAGSGTTGKVAIELGRKAILIEPKAEYVEMIKKRCQTTIGLPI